MIAPSRGVDFRLSHPRTVSFTVAAVEGVVAQDLGDTGGPIEIEVEYRFGSGRR
jgi:hypothetical protein